MNIAFPLTFALALAAGTAHAQIYRYVDNAGAVNFTDKRPVGRRYTTLQVPEAPVPARPTAFAPGGYSLETRSRYAVHIAAAANSTRLEPALIHAVISAESGYNPSARSRAGAVGLMQLMPETAARYNVGNRLDPAENIDGGTRYLRDLLRMFNNDMALALAAYNAGEEAVVKYGNRIPPYRETVDYVPRVLAYYRKYLKKS